MNHATLQLAKHTDAAQRRAVYASELAAQAASQHIADAWREVLGILAAVGVGQGLQFGLKVQDQQRIRELLKKGMDKAIDEIDSRLRAQHFNSRNDAIDGLLAIVPRATWERMARHKSGVKEAVGVTEVFRFGNILQTLTNWADLLVDGLKDGEFKALLKKLLFKPPSQQEVDQILRGDSWPDRKTWPQRLAEEGFSFDKIVNSIGSSISQGKNLSEITKDLEPVISVPYYRVARIARTESIRVAQQTQREEFKKADDIIAGYTINAVLDERTRPKCRERDGTEYYKAGYGPARGGKVKDYAEYPNPPDQTNCRCSGSPILT